MHDRIKESIVDSIKTKELILKDKTLVDTIEIIAKQIVSAYQNDKKVLFCGNGGSAADAQHFSAELSGRFYFDRKPLFAEALHVNTSYITAVANDYSYDEIYSRLTDAMGRSGDVLFCISTSGNSVNVLKAIEVANKKEMITIGLTGESGGKMKGICRHLLNVPSLDTPRIQESHIMLGHIICDLVERTLFEKK